MASCDFADYQVQIRLLQQVAKQRNNIPSSIDDINDERH